MPLNPTVEDDVQELIRLVFRFVRNAKGHGPGVAEVRDLLTAANFGPRHLPVLFALATNGPGAVGELAGRMGLSPATASQLVNELERGGFVDRREDPRDRRRTIVSLSERHRETIEGYARRRLDPLLITMETLSPEERVHFLKGWRVLVQAQERAEGVRPGGDCAGTGAHGPAGHVSAAQAASTVPEPAAPEPAAPEPAAPEPAAPGSAGPGLAAPGPAADAQAAPGPGT
jgi:DNA-binding MarR family transcriptional regulator